MRETLVTSVFFLLILNACNRDKTTDQNEVKSQYDIVVAQDGSGDFKTVQEAVNSLSYYNKDRVYVFIKSGIYKEVLEMNNSNIAFIGEDKENVVLTFDNYASKINPETGTEYGTSGSSSNYLLGNDFYAENITFQNTAGPVGQALAVYLKGDKSVFVNCNFIGNQDTWYGDRVRLYFEDCYFEGTTDFIFGPANAYFERCEIYAKGGSAITAASTESYVEYGYIFNHCNSPYPV